MRAIGSKELEKHRKGRRLTQRGGILAKCYDCMGGYADGRQDCRMEGCSLYPWMPYRNSPASSATPDGEGAGEGEGGGEGAEAIP